MSGQQSILVTGARGFLGSQIVARGRAAGRNVVAAYRGAAGEGTAILDICDAASVEAAFSACTPSLVIHCAAYGVNYAEQELQSAMAVNVEGSLRVLEAAARHGVRRIVHVGSCFEYGSHAGLISEDTPLNPTAVYGATKAAATLLMRERAQALGVPLVVARPFGMWGPGEGAHRLVPQVIAACAERSVLKLTPCEVIRDYTYVEDMAESILALVLAQDVAPGTIVNIGTGESTTLQHFVRSIAALFAAEELMQFGVLEYRATEMASLVADVSRMRQLLGERPRTPLVEGVRRMMVSAGLGRLTATLASSASALLRHSSP